MTDVSWFLLFIICSVISFFTYFTTDQDNNPTFIMSFVGALISGLVLYIYINQPQSYSEKRLTSRVVEVFQGEQKKEVIIYDVFYQESSYYLGGLVKDSTIKWVNERDISSNGSSIPDIRASSPQS